VLLIARRTLAVLAVAVATLAGATLALSTFQQEKRLSVGTVRLSVDPFHKGSLDLYVPLVDWGVRFDAVRFPARLHADLRSVDRRAVTRVAQAGTFDLEQIRGEARDALAAYLKLLIAVVVLCAAALGLLTAFAVRGGVGPGLPYTAATAGVMALAAGIALVVLLPPRGEIANPQYYAFGPDIPRALDAAEAVQRSTRNLDQELDSQLVGLARLVLDPAGRTPLQGRPTVTVASDLHNNVLSLPTLARAADDVPLLFAGDLTDRGSPLESALVRQVARLGKPFVFVSGNHDSDTLQRDLVRQGAIVLTQIGRLHADGTHGDIVTTVGGLRIAGYSDPFERRSAEDFRDRYDDTPTPLMQDEFMSWLRPLLGHVDVVMVHEPALIEPALAVLEDDPPPRPLVFVVGHTHTPEVEHDIPGVSVVNGGSVGAGGTGNLADEAPTPIGLARLIYTTEPSFQPLAADLVAIDPGSGSATARRERLD
jgi:predicted phosphodiesterase